MPKYDDSKEERNQKLSELKNIVNENLTDS